MCESRISVASIVAWLGIGFCGISAKETQVPPPGTPPSQPQELVSIGTGLRFANTLAISPDETKLVVCGERTFEMRDANSPRSKSTKLAVGNHPYIVRSIAFSPNGKQLVSGHADGSVNLWDVDSKKRLRPLLGQKGEVINALFSPDGKLIASNCLWTEGEFSEKKSHGMVIVWEAETGRELSRFFGKSAQSLGAFSPDGKQIVSHGGKFSPDGKWIFSFQMNRDLRDPKDAKQFHQSVLVVWDIETGETRLIARFPEIAADAPAEGRSIVIWDAATGKEIRQLAWLSTAVVSDVVFDPSSKRIVTIETNNAREITIRIWDPSSGEQTQTVSFDALNNQHVSVYQGPRLSVSGKRIAIVTGYAARLWDIERLLSPDSVQNP